MTTVTTPHDVRLVDAHIQFSLEVPTTPDGEKITEQYKFAPLVDPELDLRDTVAWAVVQGLKGGKVVTGCVRIVPIDPRHHYAFHPDNRVVWPEVARFINNWLSHLGGAGFTVVGFAESESSARSWAGAAGTGLPAL